MSNARATSPSRYFPSHANARSSRPSLPCSIAKRRRTRARAERADVRARASKKRKGFAEILGPPSSSELETKENASESNARSAHRVAERCPCGGGAIGATYASCCKRFHDGAAYPPDAVTLMRTRFSAYVKGKGAYVVLTTHPENPLLRDGATTASGKAVSTLQRDVEATCAKVKFYDLEIVRDIAGANGEDEHFVGFKYKCRVVGQKGFKEFAEENHSELSTFRKIDGAWKFLDGVQGET